jgi:hypothetical protein
LAKKNQTRLQGWWTNAPAETKNKLWAHLAEADRLSREIVGNGSAKDPEAIYSATDLYFIIFG